MQALCLGHHQRGPGLDWLPAKAIGLGHLTPRFVARHCAGMPAMKVDCQRLPRAFPYGFDGRLEESLLHFDGKFAPTCSHRFAERSYEFVCGHSITCWLRRHEERGQQSQLKRASRLTMFLLGRGFLLGRSRDALGFPDRCFCLCSR